MTGRWVLDDDTRPPGRSPEEEAPPAPAMTAGEELDAIAADLDRTTKAWAAAGYGYGTPEDEAREAVFARLKEWNAKHARAHGVEVRRL